MVVVVVPAASPVLLLGMRLATDVDVTGLFVIALRLLAVIGCCFSIASRYVTATATTVLVVVVKMVLIVAVVVIVVVVVVRAKIAILLLLLMVVACLGGIVVTRTEYRRRMFELLSVSIGTTVSPVLLRGNCNGAGSYGRRSILLLDHIQRFRRLLLLLLGLLLLY